MTRLDASSQSLTAPRIRIDGAEEAARLCERIETTMDALLQLIEAESKLLRSGKTLAAAAIEGAKNECARAYIDDLGLLRRAGADLDRYAPGPVARLRRRHAEFVSVLQIDLAALATARAVSDAPALPRRTDSGLRHAGSAARGAAAPRRA